MSKCNSHSAMKLREWCEILMKGNLLTSFPLDVTGLVTPLVLPSVVKAWRVKIWWFKRLQRWALTRFIQLEGESYIYFFITTGILSVGKGRGPLQSWEAMALGIVLKTQASRRTKGGHSCSGLDPPHLFQTSIPVPVPCRREHRKRISKSNTLNGGKVGKKQSNLPFR